LAVSSAFPDPEFLRRTLEEYARGYASLAAAFQVPRPAGLQGSEALLAPLLESYRRLFQPSGFAVPPAALATASPGAKAGATLVRYQQAWERCSRVASAIAVDANRRLSAALAENGPATPPITSLRDLHALWIECGEAAYAQAAHTEEFAAAQAELLGSLVELKAATQ
jgi:hypothetical protein